MTDRPPEWTVGGDYPQAWDQHFGQGRSFYTSLGHRDELWTSDAMVRAHNSRRDPMGARTGELSGRVPVRAPLRRTG